MALSRRSGQRFQASIWPGFVDAMTGLLLVLFFVLTIFMVVQFVLSDTITGQESQLDRLAAEVDALGEALGLERVRAGDLEGEVARLGLDLDQARSEGELQSQLIATLSAQSQAQRDELAAAAGQITEFEAQVAGLLAERAAAEGRIAGLEGDLAAATERAEALLSSEAALQLALAQAREEIDAGTEAARLAAARREALEALLAEERAALAAAQEAGAGLAEDLAASTQALSDEEAARLAEQAAAEALRARLAGADTELTALTLALEAERARAEETLTLLAAAEAAAADLDVELGAALSEGEARAALLASAEAALAARAAERDAASAEAAAQARQVALMNAQVAQLRAQLGSLQEILDAAEAQDAQAQVQIENLSSRLNTALARATLEERRRAALEEAERKRLEAEAQRLERYQSEFFGRLREVIGEQEGVQIVGDRFVFSSEVLFDVGQADLSAAGRAEIEKVALLLQEVAAVIPTELDWVVRVDGHTDDQPISSGRFADNWELSQARALSVVRTMIEAFGFPPDRLAATGFGEFQPVADGSSAQARARNRRIELKLTER